MVLIYFKIIFVPYLLDIIKVWLVTFIRSWTLGSLADSKNKLAYLVHKLTDYLGMRIRTSIYNMNSLYWVSLPSGEGLWKKLRHASQYRYIVKTTGSIAIGKIVFRVGTKRDLVTWNDVLYYTVHSPCPTSVARIHYRWDQSPDRSSTSTDVVQICLSVCPSVRM